MTGPRTVGDVLGATEDALRDADVIRRAQASFGTLPGVRGLVDLRVSEALQDGLGGIDLGGILIDGWRAHRALIDAARRTRAAPGPPEDVVLVEHSMAAEHHPTVEILINGAVAATLTFDVEATLTVNALEAVVESGRLVAVRAGRVVVGVTLAQSGVVIARREARVLAGALVRLGSGIVLAEAPAAAPAAAPTPWWERT